MISESGRVALLADLLTQEQAKVEALARHCAELQRQRDVAQGEASLAQRVILELRLHRDKLLSIAERRA
jgi:hypothetical protein